MKIQLSLIDHATCVTVGRILCYALLCSMNIQLSIISCRQLKTVLSQSNLPTDIENLQTDDCFVMCHWSSSRGRNTNTPVTVTITVTVFTTSRVILYQEASTCSLCPIHTTRPDPTKQSRLCRVCLGGVNWILIHDLLFLPISTIESGVS